MPCSSHHCSWWIWRPGIGSMGIPGSLHGGTPWKINVFESVFDGKTHCKWWFSIAILNYQRVLYHFSGHILWGYSLTQAWQIGLLSGRYLQSIWRVHCQSLEWRVHFWFPSQHFCGFGAGGSSWSLLQRQFFTGSILLRTLSEQTYKKLLPQDGDANLVAMARLNHQPEKFLFSLCSTHQHRHCSLCASGRNPNLLHFEVRNWFLTNGFAETWAHVLVIWAN